jgi:FkbM family methyltransferase
LPSSFFKRLCRRTLRFAGARRLLLKWQVWESIRNGEREIQLLKFLVDPKKVAIDIGAAEGVYSYCLQYIAKRCIAFEPNPGAYANLKRSLPGVESHQAAVSARDGEARLRIPVINGIAYHGWGTIESRNRLSELPPHTIEEVRVRTVRLDGMTFNDVGFIKIDVEGHEVDVLDGLAAVLAKYRPNLMIEIGEAGRGGSLAEVRHRLDPLGYVALRIDDSGVLRALPQELVN